MELPEDKRGPVDESEEAATRVERHNDKPRKHNGPEERPS